MRFEELKSKMNALTLYYYILTIIRDNNEWIRGLIDLIRHQNVSITVWGAR